MIIKMKPTACTDVTAYFRTMEMSRSLFPLLQQHNSFYGWWRYIRTDQLSSYFNSQVYAKTSSRNFQPTPRSSSPPLPGLHSLTTNASLNQATKDTQSSLGPPPAGIKPAACNVTVAMRLPLNQLSYHLAFKSTLPKINNNISGHLVDHKSPKHLHNVAITRP